MATHKLGVYLAPSHDRPGDWDYIRNLKPPVVRILMPGDAPTNLVSRVHQTAPNARIALRWWDVDDGGEGNKRGKLNSPEASAANDAKTYVSRIQQMEFDAEESGLPFPPRNKLLVNALNEAPTWEHDKRPAIVAYNRTLIATMKSFGVPVAALCLAVGHPEEWPPKWDWAQAVIDAIHASPGSVLELHSYWQLEGPNHIWTDAQGNQRKDWGALAGRFMHCPYNVPILMGEVGADGRLYDRKPQHTGWRGNIPAAEYAGQLRFYLEHIHQDERIIAALPFLTDTPDMESWGSFDTEQAHNDILAMVRSLPPIGLSVGEGPEPAPTPPAPPAKPAPTGIIEPKVAQAILKIESGGRTHGADGRIIIRFEAHIFKRHLKNDALWAQHFRVDAARPWVDQMWRRTVNDTWQTIHTGKQADEWTVFEFANTQLSTPASFMAISMGAAQIMGFNHARIGYPSAVDMYDAFRDAQLQTIGFINFCLSDPALADAMRRKDWRTVARLYNGSGAVDTYAPLLEQAYRDLGGI